MARLLLCRAAAIANQCYLVSINGAGQLSKGRTMIVDPEGNVMQKAGQLPENLMAMRGSQRQHNGRSIPPVRKEITGPNQRWCWDISYLPIYEKRVFLYLYLLLDECSRKAIAWRVSWN